MLYRIFLIVFSATLLLQSCSNDKRDQLYPNPVNNCDTANVTYSGTVQGVMISNCALVGCHQSPSGQANVTLDSYAGVKDAVGKGLVSAINHDGTVVPMPYPSGKLDDCTIAKINAWVASGAPNN
jgi:mono/diheme cytochrome c family protein